ncbi:MAG: hypothetical protein ACYDAY_06400 [Candidatus Dormibacteria bacterium]
MNEFERQVEDQLHRALDPIVDLPSRVSEARYSRLGRTSSPARRLRWAMLPAAAGAALVATGALAASAVTHSANPAAWGQHVAAAVTTCRLDLGPGQAGIGGCVSAFARENPEASPAGVPVPAGGPVSRPSPRSVGTPDADAAGRPGQPTPERGDDSKRNGDEHGARPAVTPSAESEDQGHPTASPGDGHHGGGDHATAEPTPAHSPAPGPDPTPSPSGGGEDH